ncbi:MAG: GIY-YIG nuclease family protein [Muribaculaceae bacterium]|nr:GIY-YIG nuclease family protein [Muribaculaceae bacterium]
MVDKLTQLGFKGFKTVGLLKSSCREIPEKQGVYIVLRKNTNNPEFLETGTGGTHKEKTEPNVSISELNANWVDYTPVMYIGKSVNIRQRIRAYMSFGRGKEAGHWGGRLIWQLADADDLIVCWCETEEDSREVERKMIEKFTDAFDERPFANLAD